jgi:hemerythrin-like domain-containing protein
MTEFYQVQQAESGEARHTEISVAMDRLKDDHMMLKQVLQDIHAEAKQIEAESDPRKTLNKLLHLRLWASAFTEELTRHSRWEEEELIPFLDVYFQSKKAPSVTSAFKMLEKDHDLANVYLKSFLRSVHQLKADSSLAQMKQAAAYLFLACRVYMEHLNKEEQLIFPLMEQILTDLDYLFS